MPLGWSYIKSFLSYYPFSYIGHQERPPWTNEVGSFQLIGYGKSHEPTMVSHGPSQLTCQKGNC
jgi:hypothetical protein